MEVRVSGPGGLLADLIAVFEGIDGFLLAVTASLVLVLLVLIYRSPVAAFVPLLSVGWVYALAGAIRALSAQAFGLPVNGQASGIMTVLLFGAGTDYCLFVSSRYREELTRYADKHDAMHRAMRGVNEAIASSAGTVLLATLALLLATLRSNQALGPLLAIAVGVMLVAALTLVPAILTILGRASFWPFRPKLSDTTQPERMGVWATIARVVQRRPLATLTASVVLFIVMALGTLAMDTEYDSLASLPADSESVEGFELLRAGFPAGGLSPTDAYVILPPGQSIFDPQSLAAIDMVTQALAMQEHVVNVTSPSRPFGVAAPLGPQAVASAAQVVPAPVREAIGRGEGPPADVGDPNTPESQAIGLYAAAASLSSPDREVARISATLDINPYSEQALDTIPALRDAARDAAERAGLSREAVLIGGKTATSYDSRAAHHRDNVVVLPIILLSIGIVLGLLLRSVVAPIYLLLTIVISYFATLGLSVFVFQTVLGHSGIGPGVPFLLFLFLCALGVDYNIYLMARVREETAAHSLIEGTTLALARTGGVITSAGIILAGTFAALMTLPLRDLFQLGFAVAIGVLMDTFIVRSLMVPSIVMLLGRWNWWPARRGRAAPEPSGISVAPAD
jgi:putative drug exporter of the RND superfamily